PGAFRPNGGETHLDELLDPRAPWDRAADLVELFEDPLVQRDPDPSLHGWDNIHTDILGFGQPTILSSQARGWVWGLRDKVLLDELAAWPFGLTPDELVRVPGLIGPNAL